MHLIKTLGSGIRSAPSGSAAIYTHNTTTNAVVYEDFDGTMPTTTHPLDANGAVIRYCDEIVDVVVFDVNGAQVDSFTESLDAGVVVVRNAGFTGSNTDGTTSAGGETDLNTILTNLYDSFGAVDCKVNYGGNDVNLSTALASLAGLPYYNVTAYGATGDGTTNDTTAIQNAIDAASLSGTGGIVLFPAGTYKITSALTVSTAGVSLVGLGPTSRIASAGSTANWVNITGNNVAVQDLTLQVSGGATGNTGTMINVVNATGTFVNRCVFTGNNGRCIFVTSLSGIRDQYVTVENCSFTISETSLKAIDVSLTGSSYRAFATVTGCTFAVSAISPTYGIIYLGQYSNLICAGCRFSATGAGAYTIYYIEPNTTDSPVSVTGCEFRTTGTSTAVYALKTLTPTGVVFAGNRMMNLNRTSANKTRIVAGSTYRACSMSMPDMDLAIANFETTGGAVVLSGATYTPDPNFGNHLVQQTGGTAMSFGAPSGGDTYPGQKLRFTYWNNGINPNATPTFNAVYDTPSITAVTNGNKSSFEFTQVASGAWALTSASQNY